MFIFLTITDTKIYKKCIFILLTRSEIIYTVGNVRSQTRRRKSYISARKLTFHADQIHPSMDWMEYLRHSYIPSWKFNIHALVHKLIMVPHSIYTFLQVSMPLLCTHITALKLTFVRQQEHVFELFQFNSLGVKTGNDTWTEPTLLLVTTLFILVYITAESDVSFNLFTL